MKNLRIKIVLIALILLVSLLGVYAEQVQIKKRLKEVNNIEIRFFKGKKKLVYKTSRPMDLLYLKELIIKAKNIPHLQCDTTGEIVYFKNKVQIFNAYFSLNGTGRELKSTEAVIFQNGADQIKALLNYGSVMLIQEEYYQLQKGK